MIWVFAVLAASLIVLLPKGLIGLLSFAQSIYIFPIIIILQYIAINESKKRPNIKDLSIVRYLQLLCLFISYLFLFGYDGTSDINILNVFHTTIDSSLVKISTAISFVAQCIGIFVSILLTVRLFSLKNEPIMSFKKVFLRSITISIVLVLIYLVSIFILTNNAFNIY